MRLDQYLPKVGIVKRRSLAKEMADNGLIKVNGRRSKPSGEVKIGDIIAVSGSRPVTVEVKEIPKGSVKKEDRGDYFAILN
ncbi:MAG: RNA-binding S4 domain-containing protein [Candidatus Zixiibacteriota bacterium]|nr:MAG: RNA-binding S4 domain-containing protein [candidate division Zixibacteria bacterium]